MAKITDEYVKEFDKLVKIAEKDEFWTQEFIKNAYNWLGDNKFPIVVPSYNRPKNRFINACKKYMTEDKNFEVYFLVRKSQLKEYEENKPSNSSFIHFIPIEDELINNAGKARHAIVSYFTDKEDNILMLDDDIYRIGYSIPRYSKVSKSMCSKTLTTDFVSIIAMWQISHLVAVKKFNITMSTILNAGFSFSPDYCQENTSFRLFSGNYTAAIGINLPNLKKDNLNYKSNELSGHEDIDLQIRCLDKGHNLIEFRFLNYFAPNMEKEFTASNNLYDRMLQQQQIMYDNFKDIPWVNFTNTRNNIPNVRINWRKFMKDKDIQREINGWKLILEKFKRIQKC